MRIVLAIALSLLPLAWSEAARAQDQGAQAKNRPSAAAIRENYQARLNDNTVTIMAGGAYGTEFAVVQDIAASLDDGDALRIVPMAGKGPAQTLKDVLFMRGVDMGITQANVLNHFAETGELGPLKGQITYIAKLFNEEMHVLARAEIDDVRKLDGMTVNVGAQGGGVEITARQVFGALGVTVNEVHLDEADAIAKLKAGVIDATVVVAGKPAPILAHMGEGSGLKLLNLPYAEALVETYPATFTHDDYPDLIEKGARVDTIAVCAVLVSFNWSNDHVRAKKLDRFVDRMFANFDSFLEAPRHPKWQEVNFAATLEDWQRSPPAQRWIDRAAATVAADTGTRARFETFLAQADTKVSAVSDAERAELFRAFLEWSKTQDKN